MGSEGSGDAVRSGVDLSTPANPELLAAMRAMGTGEPRAARRAVYEAILRSSLLVPLNTPHDQLNSAGENYVRVVVFKRKAGDTLPAFTDWKAVERWPNRAGPASFVVVKGSGTFFVARNLLGAVRFVEINPFGPVGLRVDRVAIEALAEGLIPPDASM